MNQDKFCDANCEILFYSCCKAHWRTGRGSCLYFACVGQSGSISHYLYQNSGYSAEANFGGGTM